MNEEVWEEMRERLTRLTLKRLKQVARDEGITLGYAASRKDTTVAEIVSQRRIRAIRGEAVTTGGETNGNDWCREYGSIRRGVKR